MTPTFSRAFPLLAALALIFSACNREPEPRRYVEIARKGEGAGLQRGPLAPIAWTLPEGWTVQPEGDPLRLTGFWAPDPALARAGKRDPKAADVSIVQLEGDAGGLTANVTRWLGQIGLAPGLAEQVIAEGVAVRAATGQRGVLLDFTGHLSGDLTQSRSIIGAIFDAGDHTVFVKAMGSRSTLKAVKPQLEAFCRGLSIGGIGEEAP